MTETHNSMQLALADVFRRLETFRCVDGQSTHHGSMDREFWCYRTTRGFSSAPFQHAMSAYALASTGGVGATAARLSAIGEHLANYWLRTRNSNGSTNEWFRNEQSYCATAMGLHALTETATAMRDRKIPKSMEQLLVSAVSSERWLRRRNNPLAMNQDVASVSARWSLGSLLSDDTMRDRARRDFDRLVQTAARIGHLSESGGFDLGYSLLSIDLLVVAHLNGLAATENLASILCERLAGVVSRSGDLPFALGSRGTRHQFFGGVHYFATTVKSAARLVSLLRSDHLTQQGAQTGEYDDRYLATFAAAALARSVVYGESPERRAEITAAPCESEAVSAALRSASSPIFERHEVGDATVFCNRTLGSSLCYIDSAHRAIINLGYSISTEDGVRACTLTSPIDIDGRASHELVGPSGAMPLVRWELLFRLLTILCALPSVARLVSWFSRTKLARPNRRLSGSFTREILCSDSQLSVVDRLALKKSSGLARIAQLLSFPFHSPSAVAAQTAIPDASNPRVDVGRVGSGTVTIRWHIGSVDGVPSVVSDEP